MTVCINILDFIAVSTKQ